MTTQFGGFSEVQMEHVARRMGFNGPMHKFNDFLRSSPHNAAKLSRITASVQQRLGETKPHMATGGVVTTTSTPNTNNLLDEAAAQSLALQQAALNNPNSLISPVQTTNVQTNNGQFVDPNSGNAGAATTATTQQTGEAQTATQPAVQPTQTVETATTAPAVDQALEGFQGAQGQLSANAQVEAAQAQPSSNATVQGQLENLMRQFEGGNTPPWAAGAKRMVDQMMIGRGMGSSTMAASASTQAMMESALQIAVQDASTFSAFEMQNLNNRQQARLQNAQAFLQLDLTNLSNEQQATMFKAQSRIQSLFSDQAAENASRQFNATSENQANQFFAQLKSQVEQFNANQKNAMTQFNTEQGNAVEMFNANVQNQRDQFNATNRLVIDQANAKWRQEIATQDNANINEANRINAQAATGMTMAAYNNVMQRERDLMAYVFTASENASQRAHEVVIEKLRAKSAKAASKEQTKGGLLETAGRFVGKLFGF